jgi:hypothetical protein
VYRYQDFSSEHDQNAAGRNYKVMAKRYLRLRASAKVLERDDEEYNVH